VPITRVIRSTSAEERFIFLFSACVRHFTRKLTHHSVNRKGPCFLIGHMGVSCQTECGICFILFSKLQQLYPPDTLYMDEVAFLMNSRRSQKFCRKCKSENRASTDLWKYHRLKLMPKDRKHSDMNPDSTSGE
jgi:hypothetical protein